MYVIRLLFFLVLLPGAIHSQGIKIGIDWEIPGSTSNYTDQLKVFGDAGISIIQIEGLITPDQIQELKRQPFEIWLSSGLKFTRRHDFKELNTLVNTVTDPVYYYRSHNLEIHRYTLIEQPQIFPGIGDSITTLVRAVQNIYDGKLDLLTHTPFEIANIIGVDVTRTMRHISNLNESQTDSYVYLTAAALNDKPSAVLRKIWSNSDFQNNIYLFNSDDFFHLIDHDADFLDLVSSFSRDANTVVALQMPQESPTSGTTSEAILLLIGLMIFITIFLSNAGYHRSLTRFTTTHNFYVNDVMMRRIRAGGDVLFAWIMTFLFGGILFHATMNATSGNVTSQMLEFHYPFLYAIVSAGTIPQLILSSILIIVIQLITFLWIFLSTKLKFQPSQILQLYLIPQQSIVLFTLCALLIFLNNGSPFYLVFFTILGFSMIFLSFPIISFDLVKYLQKNRFIFILFGPILYTLTVIFIFSWLYQSTPFIDTIKLYLQIVGF